MHKKLEKRKVLIGIVIVIGILMSWAFGRQFTYIMQAKNNFNASFFIMWFQTIFIALSIIYPLILNKNIKEQMTQENLTYKQLFFYAFLFYLLWLSANYLATIAIKNICSSLYIAIFSIQPGFVYILSRLVLNEELMIIKTFAVSLNIIGVLIIGVSQPITVNNIIGPLLTVFTSFAAANYVVFFKKTFKSISISTTMVFLTMLSLINTLFFWPVFLILDYTGVEIIIWDQVPWNYLLISSIGTFIFNILVNIGISYTYPLFISLGAILGIPTNMIIDLIAHDIQISWLQIVGSICIVIGFYCLVGVRSTHIQKEALINIDDEEKIEIIKINK